MSSQTILIVGHGSRVAEAVAEFHEFTHALSKHLHRPVNSCFLELADPDLATGLTQAAEQSGPGGQVIVLPLFLGAASHLKNDIPYALQWARQQFPRVTFKSGTHLGSHAKLVELMNVRVRESLAAEKEVLPPKDTAVLVVARGSSDPDSNSDVAKLSRLLFEKRPYLTVEYAYQAVARPRVDEGVRRCWQLGAKQVVVLPYILFTGRVEADLRRVYQQTGEELKLRMIQAGHLGIHPLLVEVTAQRLHEAIEGTPAMTCDLCKYRVSMAGYEQEVGQPQDSHHLYGGAAHSHDHHHHHDHDGEHHHHEHEHHHHH
jgi:sirohydrochlorin cobaltochelatase